MTSARNTKEYHGLRAFHPGTGRVFVREGDVDKELPLRLDLANHSPTGFAWGYGGSGPAQLALAILADCLGDDAKAVELHQPFKAATIARLDPARSWKISEKEVREALDAIPANESANNV